MSEFNASNFKKEEGGQGPDIIGTTEFTSPYFMVPPSGTTAQRPSGCAPGTLRFNTDIGSLEYFKGDTLGWESIVKTTPNLGGGTGSNTGTGARGIYAMSYQPSTSDRIEYITISTLGNAQDFGNLTGARKFGAAAASRTRGCWAGGAPSQVTIDYVTISSTGDAIDFGDRTQASNEIDGLSTEIRGVFAGGYASPALRNTMDYITIASTGNAVDFGDLTTVRGSQGQGGGASTTRGLWAGGQRTPASSNIIDYITVATTGNATDFGDLVTALYGQCVGNCSDQIRGVFAGGKISAPTYSNSIDYVTIASIGNSAEWGDLARGAYGITYGSVCSDSHGGIS